MIGNAHCEGTKKLLTSALCRSTDEVLEGCLRWKPSGPPVEPLRNERMALATSFSDTETVRERSGTIIGILDVRWDTLALDSEPIRIYS